MIGADLRLQRLFSEYQHQLTSLAPSTPLAQTSTAVAQASTAVTEISKL